LPKAGGPQGLETSYTRSLLILWDQDVPNTQGVKRPTTMTWVAG